MSEQRTNADGEGSVERVALEAAALAESQAPERVLILPWGEVKSAAGSFIVDAEALAATIAAFDEHQTDIPVDYEHQTLGGPYSSPTGQAPAAGWIKALRVVTPEAAGRGDAPTEPGLWASVEWTADAAEKLRGKHYRYLSPVALVRRSDRRVVGLHSAALTNKPAIAGMRPLVASDTIVALAPAATGGAVPAASFPPGDPWGELRRLLVLDESAADDLVVVAAAQRIRSLERTEVLRQAVQRVERATSAGKLTTAQREWALALAERNPEEFDRWEAAAPQVVPLGRSVPPTGTAGGDHHRKLSEEAARREWRSNREFLSKLCSEEAYVAAARRGAGP